MLLKILFLRGLLPITSLLGLLALACVSCGQSPESQGDTQESQLVGVGCRDYSGYKLNFSSVGCVNGIENAGEDKAYFLLLTQGCISGKDRQCGEIDRILSACKC